MVAWGLVAQLIRAQIDQGVLKRSLALHIPAHRVNQILRNHDMLKPGAEEVEVSILFSDIANYSRMMQREVLGRMIPILNDYFETSIACIHKKEGTVIKLIGDAIFAIWNAPEPRADHADLACETAILLRERLLEFDQKHPGGLSFRTRLGLHCEEVFVGNIGSRDRFDYTAMGSGVNLAARLESANKILGTPILLSDQFASKLKQPYVLRRLGQFRFQGFDQVVVVHELIGASAEAEEATKAWRLCFEAGLASMKERQFKTAETHFRRVIELRKQADAGVTTASYAPRHVPEDDGPSRLYLDQIEKFLISPPGREWFGEINLTEK